MKKHSTISIVAALFCAVGNLLFSSTPLWAEDKETRQLNSIITSKESCWKPTNITLDVRYQERFIAGRINRLLSDEPYMSLSLGAKWKTGWYFSWTEIHSLNNSDWSNGPDDETHVLIGYAGKKKSWDYKIKITNINLHPTERWFDNDRIALDFYLSRNWKFGAQGEHSIMPEIRAFWFADTQQITSGVPVFMASTTHKWSRPFGLDNLSMQTRVGIAWDGGFKRNDPDGVFAQVDTELNLRINECTTLSLIGWKMITPISHHNNDGRGNTHSTWWTGVKFSF